MLVEQIEYTSVDVLYNDNTSMHLVGFIGSDGVFHSTHKVLWDIDFETYIEVPYSDALPFDKFKYNDVSKQWYYNYDY